jgi:hypothetical protein
LLIFGFGFMSPKATNIKAQGKAEGRKPRL